MRPVLGRTSFLIPAATMALVIGACGGGGSTNDDDDTVDAQIDAPMVDAMAADASVDASPFDLRSGVIALTDVLVTNPEIIAYQGFDKGLEGAAVSVTYEDLTTATVPPAFGNADLPEGTCNVFVYDADTNVPPAHLDEGTVAIANSVHGTFQCSFAGDDYSCTSLAGTAVSSVTSGLAAGTVALTVEDADFSDASPYGMYVAVAGFANDVNNGVFPVVNYNSVVSEDTLVIANRDFEAADEEIMVADVTYTLLPGAGPIPQRDPPYDFLDDGTDVLTVSKAEGGVVPAFSADIRANGDGLVLESGTPQPHEFPKQMGQGDWTLSCDGDGACGPDDTGLVVGFVLTGTTTDANLANSCPGGFTGDDSCGPFDMPEPVGQWARFTCRGNLGARTITLPAAAVDAILGTDPTRVETRLLRVTEDRVSDESGVTTVMAGHGLVGYTKTTPN